MKQLIYHSLMSEQLTQDDIQDILSVSRNFNTCHAITGCLLHYKGEFLQLLEGDELIIKNLFNRIATDNRHHLVNLLYFDDAIYRAFDNWSMAFNELRLTDLCVSSGVMAIENLRSFLGDEHRAHEAGFKLFRRVALNILDHPHYESCE
jgi:Sensors of blue-light using FAD